MNGKVYSEQKLAVMIKIAMQHVKDPDVRNGIVSKCHREIGMLVAGMLIKASSSVDLTDQEITALSNGMRHWRRQRKSLVKSSNQK